MHSIPHKPIRIVTFKSGNGSETVIRLLAQGITERLKREVIVDYQPPGLAPIQRAIAAPADGDTLLVSLQLLWTGPLLHDMPYDPLRDLSPVTLATTSPLLVVVNAASELESIADLIALAKVKPGFLKYRSGFSGSCSQLAGALFTQMTGADIVCVPSTKGGLAGVEDLIDGHVHFMIPSAGAIMPFVKSGRLRALAVTSAAPSALAPELPTVAATLPGYEVAQGIGIFAPAQTPAVVIEGISREIVQYFKQPHVEKQLLDASLELAGSTPAGLTQHMQFEIAKWSKLIKDSGMRAPSP